MITTLSRPCFDDPRSSCSDPLAPTNPTFPLTRFSSSSEHCASSLQPRPPPSDRADSHDPHLPLLTLVTHYSIKVFITLSFHPRTFTFPRPFILIANVPPDTLAAFLSNPFGPLPPAFTLRAPALRDCYLSTVCPWHSHTGPLEHPHCISRWRRRCARTRLAATQCGIAVLWSYIRSSVPCQSDPAPSAFCFMPPPIALRSMVSLFRYLVLIHPNAACRTSSCIRYARENLKTHGTHVIESMLRCPIQSERQVPR